jgi:hypothetical protein
MPRRKFVPVDSSRTSLCLAYNPQTGVRYLLSGDTASPTDVLQVFSAKCDTSETSSGSALCTLNRESETPLPPTDGVTRIILADRTVFTITLSEDGEPSDPWIEYADRAHKLELLDLDNFTVIEIGDVALVVRTERDEVHAS